MPATRSVLQWKNVCLSVAALAVAVFLCIPLVTSAIDPVFVETADVGFGAPGNPHVGDAQGMAQFSGRLFIGAESTAEGAQIWSSPTGRAGTWRHDVNDGFASEGAAAGANQNIGMLEAFDGHLYAGTMNAIDGFQLWRWDGVEAHAWEPISVTGLGLIDSQFAQGPGLVSGGLTASEVAGGALFVGTATSATIWRSTDGTAWAPVSAINFDRAAESSVHDLLQAGGFLYAAVSADAVGTADVWRCAIATDCDAAGEWSRVFDASTVGVTIDTTIDTLHVFDGFVYAGGDSGSVYRCAVADCNEQADWSSVTQNAFGAGGTVTFTGSVSHADVLYMLSSSSLGVGLWRSLDGVHFSDIAPDDLSDENKTVLRRGAVLDNALVLFVDHTSGLQPQLADLDPVLLADPFATARHDGTGFVDVDVPFADPDLTREGQLRVQYSTNAGLSWNAATISTDANDTFASNGPVGVDNTAVRQLGTAAEGFIDASAVEPVVSFAWMAAEDLAPGNYDQLQLRVTPHDGVAYGAARVSNLFSVVVEEEEIPEEPQPEPQPDPQPDPQPGLPNPQVPPQEPNPPVAGASITVTNLQVLPELGRQGTTLSIGFTVIGDVAGVPTVTVDGRAAQYQRDVNLQGRRVYVYRYQAQGPDVEAEGLVRVLVRAESVSGRSDSEQTQVELDFSPPQTTIQPVSGAFLDSQTIRIDGSDPRQFGVGQGSGIAAVYYTVNDANLSDQSSLYNGPFVLEEGVWVVRWFAIDRAGNRSDIQQATYRIGAALVDNPEGSDLCDPQNDSACAVAGFVDEPQDASETQAGAQSLRDRVLRSRSLVSIPLGIAAIALSAANIALAAAQVGSYMRYLWQLFSEPLRWLAGKRRSSWGVVVDEGTRLPLDLVTVRLIDVETGRTTQTSVTDASGRFLFVGEPGRYRIEATKTGYEPLGAQETAQTEQLTLSASNQREYAGQVIEISSQAKESSPINVRIALQRVEGFAEVSHSTKPVWLALTNRTRWEAASDAERRQDDQRIRSAQFWRNVAHILSFVGPIVGLFILWFDPSWLHAALFVLHIILFWFFRRLARKREGSPWGRVQDVESGQSISGAVVRLFDQKHGRLLLSRVTSRSGQYGFLVGDGEYTVLGQKEGYEARRPFIPVRGAIEAVVNEDILLQRRSSGGSFAVADAQHTMGRTTHERTKDENRNI